MIEAIVLSLLTGKSKLLVPIAAGMHAVNLKGAA